MSSNMNTRKPGSKGHDVRQRSAAKLIFAGCAVLGLLLAGCEKSNKGDNADVAGTWAYSDTTGNRSAMMLSQQQASVYGTNTVMGSLAGSVSGDAINLTASYSTVVITTNSISTQYVASVTLTGTVAGDTMAGTLRTVSGASGSWNAQRASD